MRAMISALLEARTDCSTEVISLSMDLHISFKRKTSLQRNVMTKPPSMSERPAVVADLECASESVRLVNHLFRIEQMTMPRLSGL